ncbi:MAG: pyrimidine dimer DNA glycosylase/endonuclease V [Candidatus Thorarchaeota archaeon]
MRMWMVDPALMCNEHLLGEHVECHMLVGHLQRKRQITNYIRLNLLQPQSLRERHRQLALEMESRKMLHKSPLPEFDMSYLPEGHRIYIVDAEESWTELSRRCSECSRRLGVLSNAKEYANK